MAAPAHGLFQIVASNAQVSLVANRYRKQNLAYFRVVLVEVRKRDANELIDPKPAEQSGIFLEHADHVIRSAVHPYGLANWIDLREQRIRDARPDHSHGAAMFQIVQRHEAPGGYSELRYGLSEFGVRRRAERIFPQALCRSGVHSARCQ
jgi:hypothetical protein